MSNIITSLIKKKDTTEYSHISVSSKKTMNDKSESVRKNTERSDMNDRFLSLPADQKKEIYESIKNNHIPIVVDQKWFQITVTHVVCNNLFYAQINYDGLNYNPQLLDLNQHINYLEENLFLDPLKSYPADGDLVIAKYSVDDRWYRARFRYVDEVGPVVDYIDYGNFGPVALEDLRQWDDDLNVLKIQAICFSMINFAKNIGPLENIEEFIDYMMHRTFQAEIQEVKANVVLVKLKYNFYDVDDMIISNIFQLNKK